MKVPPILILDESQSLLEMLRAIGKQEHALAKYAAAEAERIAVMVKYLNDFGIEGVPSDELLSFCRQTAVNLRSSEAFQEALDSNRELVSDYLEIGPLYRLSSIPQKVSCHIRAGGRGPVSQEGDHFYQGMARLEEVDICASQRASGVVKYRVDRDTFSNRLESVEEGLKVELIEPRPPLISSGNPIVALITGYGVLTIVSGCEAERLLARFALTVWDLGTQTGNQFRMMYVVPSKVNFCHDSGIVRA